MTSAMRRRTGKPPNTVGLYFSIDDDKSDADRVASLPEEEQSKQLRGVSMDALQWDYRFWARPSQLALIESSHWMTVALAGRGWGKSYVLSIAMHKYAMAHPECRILLMGRTSSDVRDVMINGESGIMNLVPPHEKPTWNPGQRKLTWPNGSFALCYSAERPDALRGIQTHASFCDEVASYRTGAGAGLAAPFDQVKISTRLTYIHPKTGAISTPQIFIATTPKRVPQIIDIVEQANNEPDKVLLVRGPTGANRTLSAQYRETMEGMYGNTSLGRQELEGELLTDVEGALLSDDDIRHFTPPDSEWWEKLPNRVIGVDPSVSSNPNDECGIIAVGATNERHMYKRTAYVLEDGSILGSPEKWAKQVVRMARKYRAIVVAEKNQGGEMVRMVIQAEDPTIPVFLVHAAVGKMERAEPIGAAYQRGSVYHCDYAHYDPTTKNVDQDGYNLEALESQLTSWAPDLGMGSPDRMDAVVHALTALLHVKPKGWQTRITPAAPPENTTLDGVKVHDPADLYPSPNYDVVNRLHPQQQLPPGQSRNLPIHNTTSARSPYAAPNSFTRGPRR